MITPYIQFLFNLFLSPHKYYFLCSTPFWKNYLRQGNKGQDDRIIPSEMAFREWYETPNNSFGAGKRNVLFEEKQGTTLKPGAFSDSFFPIFILLKFKINFSIKISIYNWAIKTECWGFYRWIHFLYLQEKVRIVILCQKVQCAGLSVNAVTISSICSGFLSATALSNVVVLIPAFYTKGFTGQRLCYLKSNYLYHLNGDRGK